MNAPLPALHPRPGTPQNVPAVPHSALVPLIVSPPTVQCVYCKLDAQSAPSVSDPDPESPEPVKDTRAGMWCGCGMRRDNRERQSWKGGCTEKPCGPQTSRPRRSPSSF